MHRGLHLLLIFIGMGMIVMMVAHPVGAVQKSAEFYFSKGVVSYSRGAFDDALALFEKASSLDPGDADIVHYLGMTYTQLGRYEPALAHLQKALALDPGIEGIHYDLGVTYFRADDYTQALSSFRTAEKAQPDRAMVYFYQGYTHYSMGHYTLTAAPLEKAQELDRSLSQTCTFYRAMSLMKAKQYEEAETAFQETIAAEPDSNLARAAETIQAQMHAREGEEKRWRVTASLSGQYDTNVSLQSDSLPSNIPASDEEDFRAVFYLTGNYRFFDNYDWSLVGRYSFYQSMHTSLHDYDLTQNEVNLNLTRAFMWGGMPSTLGLDINYTNNLLNGRRYLDAGHLRTTWGLNPTEGTYLQGQYRLETKDFHFSIEPIPSSSGSRDGENHLVGLNYFWFHCNNSRYWRCGLFYDRDNSDGDDWEYNGYQVLTSYFRPIWMGVNLILDGEYYYQDYDNVDSVGQRERSDREYTWSVSLDRDFGANLNVSLMYLGREHNSNIDLYEYDRSIFSLTVTTLF